MTDKSRYFIAIIFVGFIGAFALMFWITPKESFSPKEKRYLQKFPEFSFDSVTDKSFEKGFESYINDHMVLRDEFMELNSCYNLLAQNNGADGVYKCSDGYLINEPKANERLSLNLSVTADFAEKTGIDTTLMIIPSTGYIMDNVLPYNHREYLDDEYYSEITSFCKTNKLGFVDLRDTFRQNRSEIQLYYKTDHHWTTAGAYLAYNLLCDDLKIKPVPAGKFSVEKYNDFYGTTYNASGLWHNESDTLELWSKADNRSTCDITANGTTTSHKSMFFRANLSGSDKYEVFLNGNNPITTVKNPKSKSKKKLLIIKDSFSHCLTPFLTESFAQITLVDMRYYKKSVSEEICQTTHFDKALICFGIDNFISDKDYAFLD